MARRGSCSLLAPSKGPAGSSFLPGRRRLLAVTLACLLPLAGCSGPQDEGDPGHTEAASCTNDDDCERGQICSIGRCKVGCRTTDGCADGYHCLGQICVPLQDAGTPDDGGSPDGGEPLPCPEEMVLVEPGDGQRWCVDRYEASRADAAADRQGTSTDPPRSRAGVIPWMNASLQEATSACAAAGKRLCTPREWEITCRGPADTDYAYGDTYDPLTCNGIDTFERWHVEPTGAFPQCTNGFGVFDINGNVWEYDTEGTGRGGAYNCSDSRALHRCGYRAEWGPQAKSNFGFRCCMDPLS